MPYFSQEELNLICIYDPGNLSGLIYELAAMMHALMPDEKELYNLAHGVIEKLYTMNDKSYEKLSDMLIRYLLLIRAGLYRKESMKN